MEKEHTVSLSCSFCGKEAREVRKLIAGPTLYICDECIKLCNDLIAAEKPPPAEDTPQPRTQERARQLALCCSFCGKNRGEVTTPIAGPSVYICDECVGLCNDIIAEEIGRLDATDTLRATLPNDVRAFVAGILERGLPAVEGIQAVLQERIARDTAPDRDLGLRRLKMWSLASEFVALHGYLLSAAPQETDHPPDDPGAQMSGDASSGLGAELPGWVRPIVERIRGVSEVLGVLSRRSEEPGLEELDPSVDLASEGNSARLANCSWPVRRRRRLIDHRCPSRYLPAPR